MMYRSEAWTLRKADERRIEAAEMSFLRKILRLVGNMCTNESILRDIDTTRQLLNVNINRRLKYMGHD